MKIPVRLSEDDFNRLVLPFLRVAKRGFVSKFRLDQVFNKILYRLTTGCQWRMLPLDDVKFSWQTARYHFAKWSEDGSLEKIFLNSLREIHKSLKIQVIHLDGSHTAAKKGATPSSIKAGKNARPQICSLLLIIKDLLSQEASRSAAITTTILLLPAITNLSSRN